MGSTRRVSSFRPTLELLEGRELPSSVTNLTGMVNNLQSQQQNITNLANQTGPPATTQQLALAYNQALNNYGQITGLGNQLKSDIAFAEFALFSAAEFGLIDSSAALVGIAIAINEGNTVTSDLNRTNTIVNINGPVGPLGSNSPNFQWPSIQTELDSAPF